MRNILYKLLLMIILSGLIACAPKSSIVLQDLTCSPPCWQNITPGKTTEQETFSILSTSPIVDPNSLRVTTISRENDSVIWQFNDNVAELGGTITFTNGVVSAILIFPKENNLSFSDLVKELGEPEEVLAVYSESERAWLSIYVLYPSKGHAFLGNVVPFRKGDRAVLDENYKVTALWYFDPSLFERLMTDFTIDSLDPNTIKRGIQPWTGFGEITYVDR